jgi:hypothetical protein
MGAVNGMMLMLSSLAITAVVLVILGLLWLAWVLWRPRRPDPVGETARLTERLSQLEDRVATVLLEVRAVRRLLEAARAPSAPPDERITAPDQDKGT